MATSRCLQLVEFCVAKQIRLRASTRDRTLRTRKHKHQNGVALGLQRRALATRNMLCTKHALLYTGTLSAF